MRLLVFVTFMLISTTGFATDLRIFEQDIRLRADCSLEIKHSDGTVEIQEIQFKNKDKCVVLWVSGTNVPRLEFVKGDYVFLIESQIQSGKDCRGELAAVIVSKSGNVKVGPKMQRTGVCGYGERKDFEILHYHATQ